MQFSMKSTKTQKTIQNNTTNQPTNQPKNQRNNKMDKGTQNPTTPHQDFGDTESVMQHHSLIAETNSLIVDLTI